MKRLLMMALAGAMAAQVANAQEKKPARIAHTNEAEAGQDFAMQGEYEGTWGDDKAGAQVIAMGNNTYEAVILPGGLPGAGWNGTKKIKVKGDPGKLAGEGHTLKIDGGMVTGTTDKGAKVELKKVRRTSPTVGLKPPQGATILFDGTQADAFINGKLDANKLLVVGTMTKAKFGDFTLHLEFQTPFMPNSRGQGRGNSGVYIQNRYELQVLDSFGLSGENNECGGIYTIAKPKVNMCLPPLTWQTYDIDFVAAKFDADGKKTADAILTVKHNGVAIHDKLMLPKATPGGEGKESAGPGPFQLQDHGDPVRYRNIWVIDKK
ncbi:MAG: DUF1080 domain-containing protein [Planctomycetes bacterium]|nr:DUF1080 domain-containing protein [Planctomycetota bacterium]